MEHFQFGARFKLLVLLNLKLLFQVFKIWIEHMVVGEAYHELLFVLAVSSEEMGALAPRHNLNVVHFYVYHRFAVF